MDVDFEGYQISDDKDRIQIDRVRELLSTTYWAKDRERDAIQKSIVWFSISGWTVYAKT